MDLAYMLGRTHGLAALWLTHRESLRLAATNKDLRSLLDELPHLWRNAVNAVSKSLTRWNASKVRAAGIQRRYREDGTVTALTKAERIRCQRTPPRVQITAHLCKHARLDLDLDLESVAAQFKASDGCCRSCLTYSKHIAWDGVCLGCFHRAGEHEVTAAEATALGVPLSKRSHLPYRRVAKGWGFQKRYRGRSVARLLKNA